MRIGELEGYLTEIFKASNNGDSDGLDRGSIFLLGSMGIGKTTGVNESGQKIASLLGREFIFYSDSLFEKIMAEPGKYFVYVDLNLNDCEPSDLTGIPKENGHGFCYRPFLWAVCLSHPDIAGILCLDDFNSIQRLDVITASFKIMLDHQVGFIKFSKQVMIVAMGNPTKESTVANLLPCPLVNRSIFLEIKRSEVDGWSDWMDRNHKDWDRRSLAYLMYFKDELLQPPQAAETLENFPSPRSWTKISLLLPKISAKRWQEVIVGSLGVATGEKFFSFLQSKIPSVEELLRNPGLFNDLKIDEKYLASVLIGIDLKNRLMKDEDKKRRESETERTLPLLRVIKDCQHEFIVLAVISGGEAKTDVALALARKEKGTAEILRNISILRAALEV